MKKTIQATVLVVLAASAIVSAAISREPNVKSYWPDDWQDTSRQALRKSNNATTYSLTIFNNNKN